MKTTFVDLLIVFYHIQNFFETLQLFTSLHIENIPLETLGPIAHNS